MRDTYHDQLDELTDGLVDMSALAAAAVTRATRALLDTDLGAGEQVIAGDSDLNDLYRRLDALAFDVLARQQPVASDLRVIVTALRMMTDLERAGDYAVHLAKIARRRHPSPVLPEDLRDVVAEMGERAASITSKAGEVIRGRDLAQAAQLLDDDDAVDALQRALFLALLTPGRQQEAEEVVDITLVGRYYERLADHAVAVARGVSYLVTGRRAALSG
jgi:phosphate transport system protein